MSKNRATKYFFLSYFSGWTNYIEVIERALVDRPGRIDVIIKLPLPDRALRRHIISLYAGKATIAFDRDLEKVLDDTNNVSPAFLKELTKRAALTAIAKENIAKDSIINLKGIYFRTAFEDLKKTEGTTAKRIVGFAE